MLFGKRKRIVKRILIVEDEPLVAFDNESMLSDAGYDVVATVDRVSAALEHMSPGGVDLVLTDVKLAGARSGLDLAEEARRLNIPVLLVTAHVPPGASDLALAALKKPYNERGLKSALEAIEDHLQGRKKKLPKGLVIYAEEE
ncbi:response regulator [Sphingomonas ginkgonis]|uniref:Response regulator n=1 Tax=Sphingomonas ginkgonis TaxID=2315330 RepID=A0A3S0EME8_9SPHN|nr:response regulator [Sphingomonas ginkgonis]RST30890.1 response regulator [Sphingomonas ginkgonis]